MHKLTPMERLSLIYSANGMTHKEIAKELDLSPHTSKDYLKNARLKLRAKNIAHAVAIAMASGVIEADELAEG